MDSAPRFIELLTAYRNDWRVREFRRRAFGKLCFLARNCPDASTGEAGSIPVLSKTGKIPQENWVLQSVENGKRRGGIVGASGYRSIIGKVPELEYGARMRDGLANNQGDLRAKISDTK